MTGPFTDADDGELFITNRCNRCVHCTDFGEPCGDFLPVWVNEWPEILTPVPVSDHNPVGVECARFQVDLAAETAEALVRGLRRQIDSVKLRVEVGRSVGAAIRSEMALAGRDGAA